MKVEPASLTLGLIFFLFYCSSLQWTVLLAPYIVRKWGLHLKYSGGTRKREALLAPVCTLIISAEVLNPELCHTWKDLVLFEVMIKILHGSCWEVHFFPFFSLVPLSFCSALKHLFYLHECIQQADCSLPENSSHECKWHFLIFHSWFKKYAWWIT